MRVVTGHPASWPVQERPSALTVGVFDGLHLGHRTVIAEVVARAAATGAVPGVVTFDPHPLTVVAPERAPRMLTDIEQRIDLLREEGIGLVAVYGFAEETRRWSPEQFVVGLLTDRLRASTVVVGEDFRFGRDRAGDVAVLAELGAVHGFATVVMPLVAPGAPTSSTGIRGMLAAGDVVAAAAALQRPHEVRGVLREGWMAVPAWIALPRDGRYTAIVSGAGDDTWTPVAVITGPGGIRVVAGDPVDGLVHLRFLAPIQGD